MKYIFIMIILIAVAFVVTLVLSWGARPPKTTETKDFKGYLVDAAELEADVLGGGLLSERGMELAVKKKYRTVIDLRTPSEGTAEEKQLVEKYGLHYVNIPVTVPGMEQAEALRAVLSQPGVKPAILHCRTGRRVKALWVIYTKIR